MKYLKITAFVLLAAMLVPLFSACGSGDAPEETTPPAADTSSPDTQTTDAETTTAQPGEDEPAQENGNFTIMKDGESLFSLVRGDTSSDGQRDAAVKLNEYIKEKTGKALYITTDYVKRGEEVDESGYEILIGSTNRSASKELEAKLGKNQFAIKTTDNKIVIVGGTDSMLMTAVAYFADNYLVDGKSESGEGLLKLKTKINYVSENISMLKNIFDKSDTLDSKCNAIMTAPAPSSTIKTLQGGCVYGGKSYMIFIAKDTGSNEENNVDRIVVSDIATGKTLKESGDLSLNHANDITYNPKINKLVVCHNNPHRNYVSLIDPDTLELSERKTIPLNIYSIDYNALRDVYVVGIAGGQSFRFLTPEFQFVSGQICNPTTRTTGYTTQGICCDDNFIYHVLFKENVITVYGWDGSFKTLIKLNVGSIEPENISVMDDEIYIACNSGGAKIFKVAPFVPET